MQGVISSVADVIGSELTRAKQRIVTGRDELQAEVKKLPADLQAISKEAAGEFAGKFDELTEQVNDKGPQLVDTLASKYGDRDAASDRPEPQILVGGDAEHVTQARAVGRGRPAHCATSVARDGVGVELVALTGGLSQPRADGLGQFGTAHAVPGARSEGSSAPALRPSAGAAASTRRGWSPLAAARRFAPRRSRRTPGTAGN
jgi:hypothetical protein